MRLSQDKTRQGNHKMARLGRQSQDNTRQDKADTRQDKYFIGDRKTIDHKKTVTRQSKAKRR
jgi:hypothetical protein